MSSERFARRQRLASTADYRHVFAQPHKCGDKHLTLLCRANSKSYARLGLVVAKRHIKKAVSRNRFKRVVKESFRRHAKQLAGLDVIVLARAGAEVAGNQELSTALSQHWQRLKKQCK